MTPTIVVSRRSVQLLRILVSGIFLVAGFNHLVAIEKTAQRIEMAEFKGFAIFFGNLELLVILSGVVMLLAGFSLLIGFKTRWAAIVLLFVLLPITITIQVGQINSLGPLFKNIAIAGGLLFFILNDIKTFKKTRFMKTILSTLILSMVLVVGTIQQSHSQESAKHNYVVLTKKVAQLKPILLAAKSLAAEDGKSFGNFEIIVCGKEIGDLTNLEKMQIHLAEAEKVGANIIACGFSLKKFHVDAKKLPKNMKIVANGILHNLELQKKGYLSLSL